MRRTISGLLLVLVIHGCGSSASEPALSNEEAGIRYHRLIEADLAHPDSLVLDIEYRTSVEALTGTSGWGSQAEVIQTLETLFPPGERFECEDGDSWEGREPPGRSGRSHRPLSRRPGPWAA